MPPAVVPPEARRMAAYTPPVFVPPGMDRLTRNLIVWGICAIVIVVVVIVFKNLMLPAEMRELIAPYVK